MLSLLWKLSRGLNIILWNLVSYIIQSDFSNLNARDANYFFIGCCGRFISEKYGTISSELLKVRKFNLKNKKLSVFHQNWILKNSRTVENFSHIHYQPFPNYHETVFFDLQGVVEIEHFRYFLIIFIFPLLYNLHNWTHCNKENISVNLWLTFQLSHLVDNRYCAEVYFLPFSTFSTKADCLNCIFYIKMLHPREKDDSRMKFIGILIDRVMWAESIEFFSTIYALICEVLCRYFLS